MTPRTTQRAGERHYEPFDQQAWLGRAPWKQTPALEAWEAAHGHDVRLKCYVEFGCQVIEPTLERTIEQQQAELNRFKRGEWTDEERRLFLFEATKASYAEGTRAGCEELAIHAAEMDEQIEQQQARIEELEDAASKAYWKGYDDANDAAREV